MSDLLDRIVHRTQEDLLARKSSCPRLDPSPDLSPNPFVDALSGPELSLIAELKPRSPSRGPLREDVGEAFPAYASRAHAASVLIDGPFFGGGLDLLQRARELPIPRLAKGFFLDPYQVDEARTHGASAILLIARILDDERMASLLTHTRALGMEALVEVHTDQELGRALDVGASIVGVNARDLDTLEIDLDAARQRLDRIPGGVLKVAESGLERREDVDRVRGHAHAALIGHAFMTARDISGAMEALGW